MIPIRDSIPNVHRPWAVWTIIALNTTVFLYTLSLSVPARISLLHMWGVIPLRYTDPAVPKFFASVLLEYVPCVSYMFLHSGWMHFLLNMWVLWIFADNVEDVMGPFRFTAYYLLCGFVALFAHLAANPNSKMPIVGASGAIAGVMGAYFVLYPHGKVEAVIPIFFFPWIVELPAALFLGFWFFIQIASGVAGSFMPGDGGVAWWAHAGGFLAGIGLLPFFKIESRCYYCWDKARKRYERED